MPKAPSRLSATCRITAGLTVGLLSLSGPLSSAHAATAETAIDFATAVTYDSNTSTGAQALQLADLNGDGDVDIAAIDSSVGLLSILIGDGDGDFADGVTYPVSPTPVDLAIGDVNNDGVLDVVVVPSSGSNTDILYGNGDGTFQAAVTLASPAGKKGVAVADLNGDGDLDIIASSKYLYSTSQVSVMMGDGSGSFSSPVNYVTGAYPGKPMVADFTGDSIPDIVTANQSANTVSTFIGNGDGTFGSAVSSPGSLSTSSGAGDFDGDGFMDVVVAAYGTSMALMLGDGSGAFTTSATVTTGTDPWGVGIGDLNGDGNLDVAVGINSNGTVGTFLGDGEGGLGPQSTFSIAGGPKSVGVADINSDGRLDVTTANTNAANISGLVNISDYEPDLKVTPTSGPASGGTELTITGTNFASPAALGATSVMIGGRPATAVNVVSNTRLTARTPTGVHGPATIKVATPLVSVSRANAFTFEASTLPPQILPPGAVPAKIKNSGVTILNKKNAKTVEGQPVKATARTQLRTGLATRGDMQCIKQIRGPKRQLKVQLSGKCALRITVTWRAPGTDTSAPLKVTKTYTTKRVR